MTILQLSDPHTEERGFLAYDVADTCAMIYAAVRHIKSLRNKPDMVIVTGDIASEAKNEAYVIFRDAISQLEIPVYILPGNHDNRETMMRHLSRWCPADPAILPNLCYRVHSEEAWILCVDTTETNQHNGFFNDKEAQWLERKLEENAGALPVLIFMHHFPFHTGMKHMDEPFVGVEKFAQIMRRFPGGFICCGHMHRAFTTLWENCLAASCPSSAMQMEIDISQSGGDAFFMEAPGYALHSVRAGNVITFFGQIDSDRVSSGPHAFLGLNYKC